MIVAFVCSLSVYFACTLTIIRLTLCNQLFMENTILSSSYVEIVTDEINHTISDLGRGSNVPENVLSSVVTEKQVEENIMSYIHSLYSDSVFQIKGSSVVQQKVKERIVDYAKNKNYPLDEPVQLTIETLQTSAVTAVQQAIEMRSLNIYGKKLLAYKKIIDLLIVFSLTVSFSLFASIISLNRRFWHRVLRYLAYVLCSSSLMLVTLPLILYVNQIVERIGISSKTLYIFLTTYGNHFILIFIKWGGVIFFISIICFWGSEYTRRNTITSKN
ncbi:hypothetical protein EGW35_10420 [Enterococcus durans]|nr:hypothetical protein CUM72_09875 [Enterococcus durans]QED59820.1 hypothetical protein FS851_07970 [Enterococcus durans]QED61839.1 hypothetical protein FUT28_04625 [Enterococcus durans]ROX81594.1 hypothetical protein EGW35_10420 [Enterococcus durans]TKN18463.1 hypothetical protein DVW83_05885 [Enterococcus sp. VV15]